MTTGTSILKQGGELIGTAGTAIAQKLDEAGVTKASVTSFVSSAADKTLEVGSKLY